MRKFFLIDDFNTLNFLKNKKKIDANSIVIFLNRLFINHKDFFFEKKNFFFYDEWIEPEQQKKISLFLNNFLFKWNKNSKSEDLSQFDSFSIGNNFNDSIRIFAVSFLKQYYSFLNILKKNDFVYFYGRNNQTIDILKYLQKKINFNFFLNTPINFQIVEDHTIRRPSKSMQIYINIFYNNNFFIKFKSIIQVYILFIFNKFLIKSLSNCVILIRSGKTEELKNFLLFNKNKIRLNWGLTFNSYNNFSEIFFSKKKLFFFARSIFIKQNNKLNIKISKLFNHLKRKRIKYLPCKEIFLEAFSEIFKNQFNAAYFQYLSDYSYLKKIKPKLCIITADNYPDHIILAQAAKNLKITTAFYPHGLTGPGEIQLRIGKDSIFDYFFAFGNFDYNQYLKSGIKKEKIFIINNQYFQNFLSIKKTKKKFNKCLILDQDEGNDDPFFKIKHIYLSRKISLFVAKKLRIKVIGIKSREHIFLLDYAKKINYKGDDINVYYPQDLLLTDTFDKVDFLIGNPGTALVESILSHTPFYSLTSYQNKYKKKWYPHPLKDYIFLSENAKQLLRNVKNKLIFKKNKSIKNFVNLRGIKSAQDLYNLMENKIYNIVND